MYRQLRRQLNDGEIPLLTRSQLAFLDEVNDIVEITVNTYEWYIPDDDEQTLDVVLQLSAVEENLDSLIRHLRHGRLTKLRFAETYPKWKRNREDCMVQLKEISDSISSDRFNCNVSKLVGYSTSLLGGIVFLASAIAIPFTVGLSTPLAIAGGSMTAAGCATAIGTSITEVVLLKNKVEQAKQLIEEDQKYFEELGTWINNASGLQNALAGILGIDIMQDIIESIKDLVNRAIIMKNDTERFNFIHRQINFFIQNFGQYFREFLIPATLISTIFKVCVAVFLLLLNTENRLVFDCASVTIRSLFGVVTLLDDATDVIRLSSLLTKSGMAATHAQAFVRGGLATFGMVLDVIGIVLTSKDVHNGSQSPEANKINEALIKMREEADRMETLYANMTQSST